ncbi:MAG: hypothetical protein AAF443_07745, partial [Chlamydiota bacterium]
SANIDGNQGPQDKAPTQSRAVTKISVREQNGDLVRAQNGDIIDRDHYTIKYCYRGIFKSMQAFKKFNKQVNTYINSKAQVYGKNPHLAIGQKILGCDDFVIEVFWEAVPKTKPAIETQRTSAQPSISALKNKTIYIPNQSKAPLEPQLKSITPLIPQPKAITSPDEPLLGLKGKVFSSLAKHNSTSLPPYQVNSPSTEDNSQLLYRTTPLTPQPKVTANSSTAQVKQGVQIGSKKSAESSNGKSSFKSSATKAAQIGAHLDTATHPTVNTIKPKRKFSVEPPELASASATTGQTADSEAAKPLTVSLNNQAQNFEVTSDDVGQLFKNLFKNNSANIDGNQGPQDKAPTQSRAVAKISVREQNGSVILRQDGDIIDRDHYTIKYCYRGIFKSRQAFKKFAKELKTHINKKAQVYGKNPHFAIGQKILGCDDFLIVVFWEAVPKTKPAIETQRTSAHPSISALKNKTIYIPNQSKAPLEPQLKPIKLPDSSTKVKTETELAAKSDFSALENHLPPSVKTKLPAADPNSTLSLAKSKGEVVSCLNPVFHSNDPSNLVKPHDNIDYLLNPKMPLRQQPKALPPAQLSANKAKRVAKKWHPPLIDADHFPMFKAKQFVRMHKAEPNVIGLDIESTERLHIQRDIIRNIGKKFYRLDKCEDYSKKKRTEKDDIAEKLQKRIEDYASKKAAYHKKKSFPNNRNTIHSITEKFNRLNKGKNCLNIDKDIKNDIANLICKNVKEFHSFGKGEGYSNIDEDIKNDLPVIIRDITEKFNHLCKKKDYSDIDEGIKNDLSKIIHTVVKSYVKSYFPKICASREELYCWWDKYLMREKKLYNKYIINADEGTRYSKTNKKSNQYNYFRKDLLNERQDLVDILVTGKLAEDREKVGYLHSPVFFHGQSNLAKANQEKDARLYAQQKKKFREADIAKNNLKGKKIKPTAAGWKIPLKGDHGIPASTVKLRREIIKTIALCLSKGDQKLESLELKSKSLSKNERLKLAEKFENKVKTNWNHSISATPKELYCWWENYIINAKKKDVENLCFFGSGTKEKKFQDFAKNYLKGRQDLLNSLAKQKQLQTLKNQVNKYNNSKIIPVKKKRSPK